MFRWGRSLAFLLLMPALATSAAEFSVESPNGRIEAAIETGENVTLSVSLDDAVVLNPSPIDLHFRDGGEQFAATGKWSRKEKRTIYETIQPRVPTKASQYLYRANALTLENPPFQLEIRAHDDGVAYRWRTAHPGQISVNEQITLNFPPVAEYGVTRMDEPGTFYNSFERDYSFESEDTFVADQKHEIYLPAVVRLEDGPLLALTETNLSDYAGLYFLPGGKRSMRSVFPLYPTKIVETGPRGTRIDERADYIARTKGNRAFPWRIIVIAEEDGDLIRNQLVYSLADEPEMDFSWVRPGLLAWDWWHANVLYDVPFESGKNTLSYLHYIDFAAENGIPYIMLDGGWSDKDDLFQVNPDIDLPRVMRHAKERGVGVFLWALWRTFNKQMIPALDWMEAMGVAGIKVDFMDRDDQVMVRFYEKVFMEAAKRRMLVNMHGAYKPAGLRRKYPNFLTSEGVVGLEYNKWSDRATPEKDVTHAFIRMLAGPLDYTPGAMRNATEENHRSIYDRPMSQGTRVHQLSMYVIYESPLQMMADSPSQYRKEPESLAFIREMPVTWDETVVLQAELADFVAIARRKEDRWFLGAMTDWDPRQRMLSLDFLEPGRRYHATLFEDGPNAHRFAEDFRQIKRVVTASDTLEVKLGPGGGFAARFDPID
jgi:alpha-glucosidase